MKWGKLCHLLNGWPAGEWKRYLPGHVLTLHYSVSRHDIEFHTIQLTENFDCRLELSLQKQISEHHWSSVVLGSDMGHYELVGEEAKRVQEIHQHLNHLTSDKLVLVKSSLLFSTLCPTSTYCIRIPSIVEGVIQYIDPVWDLFLDQWPPFPCQSHSIPFSGLELY